MAGVISFIAKRILHILPMSLIIYFTFGMHHILPVVVTSLVVVVFNSLVALENQSLGFSKKSAITDNSPQARFARDELSQLEMEQEIDRQLREGESGTDQMNLAKGYKEVPVEEYERKNGISWNSRKRNMTYNKVKILNQMLQEEAQARKEQSMSYAHTCGIKGRSCYLCDQKSRYGKPTLQRMTVRK